MDKIDFFSSEKSKHTFVLINRTSFTATFLKKKDRASSFSAKREHFAHAFCQKHDRYKETNNTAKEKIQYRGELVTSVVTNIACVPSHGVKMKGLNYYIKLNVSCPQITI